MSDDNLLQDNPVEPRHITTYDREIYINFSVEMTALDDNGHFKEIVVGNKLLSYSCRFWCGLQEAFDEFLKTLINNWVSMLKRLLYKSMTQLNIYRNILTINPFRLLNI